MTSRALQDRDAWVLGGIVDGPQADVWAAFFADGAFWVTWAGMDCRRTRQTGSP